MPRIRLENLHDEILQKLYANESNIPFYLDCDSLSEANLKGLSYVNGTEPPASIDLSVYKFGIGSYAATTAGIHDIVIPKYSNHIDFTNQFSISVWIKKSAGSVTIWQDLTNRFTLALDSSGRAVVTVYNQQGSLFTCQGVTNVATDTWHNIIVVGQFNSLSTTDLIRIYVDGTSDAAIVNQDIYVKGSNTGSWVLGQGLKRGFESTVNYQAATLPEDATPAWTKAGSGPSAVVNGILTIDTFTEGGESYALWTINNGANWTVSNTTGYWVESKARVYNGTSALRIEVADGSKTEYVLIYKDKLIAYNNGGNTQFALDGTNWHVYRLVVKGSNAYIYVDGKRVLTTTPATTSNNLIRFGEPSMVSGENAQIDLEYLRYYQTAADENDFFGSNFGGNIDALTVYNEIVDPFEITKLQSKTGSELALSLNEKLNQEIVNRQSGDSSLTASGSAEASTRAADDIIIEGQIDVIEEHLSSTVVDVHYLQDNKADLVAGMVPVSQLPPQVKEMRYVNTIAERNALSPVFVGLTCFVADATADPTVISGGAFYMCTQLDTSSSAGGTDDIWVKISEAESLDVVTSWGDVINKPVFGTGHNDFARGDAVVAEASSRAAADINLLNQFNGLDSTLSSATAEFDSRISAEITNRQTAVSNEASSRTANDTAISSSTALAMTNEISTRTANDNIEASSRTAADLALQNQIDSIDLMLSSTSGNLALELAAEASTRAANDTAISSSTALAMTNEISTRTANDTAISSSTALAMTNEISTRTANDTAISSSTALAMTNEISTRTANDTAISSSAASALAGEASTRLAEDNYLQNEISSNYETFLSSTADIYNILDVKADLVNGIIPIDQIPAAAKEMKYVANIAARDAIVDKFVGLMVLVEDATADLSVSSGSAVYFCYSTGPAAWKKISELDATDLFTSWDHIQNKPSFGTGAGDFATGASVVNEASSRVASDLALQNQIDTLDTGLSSVSAEIDTKIASEASTRTANDTAISSSTALAMTNEISTRTANDTAISSSAALAMTNEISTRTANDTAISSSTALAMTNEISTRTANDTAISSSTALAMTNEISTRTAADLALQNQIDLLDLGLSSTSAELDVKIAAEASTRTANDTAISSSTALAMTNEISTRTANDTAISSSTALAMTNEISTRTANDTAISSSTTVAINAEASTRTVVDDLIEDHVTFVENTLSSTTAEIDARITNLRFIDLSDTEQYTSHANEIVQVNPTENGLTYIPIVDLSSGLIAPIKQVEQIYIATAGQTEFNLDYIPATIESLTLNVNGQEQFVGPTRDFTIDMEAGTVTFLNRSFVLQNGDEVRIRYTRGTEATHSELNGIVRSMQEPLVGTIDGNNKVFTVSEWPATNASMVVFKNSTYQSQGVGYDYTVNGKTITFDVAPLALAKLWAMYDVYNAMTAPVQEKPNGNCDGSNKAFNISELPVNYQSVALYLGGVWQAQGASYDYTILGKNIEFNTPPANGSVLWAVYNKNSSNLLVGSNYSDISANDLDTDVTGAELEKLTNGSIITDLHYHNSSKSINFFLHCNTLKELTDKGLITNYTDYTDYLKVPPTSVVTYNFASANIDSVTKKFGDASYNFNNTSYSLLLPKLVNDYSRISFNSKGGMTLWVKNNGYNSVTLWEDIVSGAKLAINSSGQPVFSIEDPAGTAYSVTKTTSITDNNWHFVAIKYQFNNATNDYMSVDVDNSGTFQSLTGQTIIVKGGEVGNLILGSAKKRNGDTIYECNELPASATPAWTKSSSGTVSESVSAGVLTIDTTGDVDGVLNYTISGGADWTVSNVSGYWAEIKAKIITSGTNATSGLYFKIGDGTKGETVMIQAGRVKIYNNNSPYYYYTDTSKWHVYRLVVKASVAYLFIDGVKVFQSVASASADSIYFGDLNNTSGDILNAQVDYIQYYQTAAEETELYANECNSNIDAIACFAIDVPDTNILTSLYTNTPEEVVMMVDGGQIRNVGNAHAAIQELVDQREYEENLGCRMYGYCPTGGSIQQPIQFSTKKRVIPTVVITTLSSFNTNGGTADYVTVNGFTCVADVIATSRVEYEFMWQAQCASYTKFTNIGVSSFKLTHGTPVIVDGEPTGEYSTAESTIQLSNLTESSNGKSYIVTISGSTIIIPKTNEEQVVDLIYGVDTDHITAQALKVVKAKLGETDYNSLQSELRNKYSVKQQLVQVYNEKLNEWVNSKSRTLTARQLFLINNISTVLSRINNGNPMVTDGDL